MTEKKSAENMHNRSIINYLDVMLVLSSLRHKIQINIKVAQRSAEMGGGGGWGVGGTMTVVCKFLLFLIVI